MRTGAPPGTSLRQPGSSVTRPTPISPGVPLPITGSLSRPLALSRFSSVTYYPPNPVSKKTESTCTYLNQIENQAGRVGENGLVFNPECNEAINTKKAAIIYFFRRL